MGWYRHVPAQDFPYTYAGKSEVFHRPSETEIIPPVFALVGLGVERRVATRLALRADVQGLVCVVYPVTGLRMSAGVSIPLGRVRK